MKKLIIIIFLFFVQSTFASPLIDVVKDSIFMKISDESAKKNITEVLIDSLIDADNNKEKAILSRKVAWKLVDTDWDRCIKYINISENNALSYNNIEFLMDTYSDIADLYYSKDLLDIALKYYIKAYNLSLKSNNKDVSHDLENDIAIIYARLNKSSEAFHYFQKIYKNKKEEKDTLDLAKVYNNIGLLYFNTNIDSSIYYFKKSLELVYELDNTELSVYVFTNIGKCYSIKRNDAKTDFYFRKSLALIDSVSDDKKAWIIMNIAIDLLQRDKVDSAIHYANSAIDLIQYEKYSFNHLDLEEILYKAYIKKEEFDSATQKFLIYKEIRDSLNVEQKAVNAEKIKLEQEFLIENQKRSIEENNIRMKYLIIGFSLVVILLILIILLSKYKHRLQKSILEKELMEVNKDELNKDLDSKKRILIAKAMKEIHRTELVQEILNDLKEVKLKAVKKETQAAIDIIQYRLEKDTSKNIWEEFELSLEQVHENFYTNLMAKHPNLTSKDKRLCALLVLNLSSKEIGHITGQDFKTVENARTRLRKKLDLTNRKIDLVTYLTELK